MKTTPNPEMPPSQEAAINVTDPTRRANDPDAGTLPPGLNTTGPHQTSAAPPPEPNTTGPHQND